LSPSVYPDLTRVPTWNYLAVHCKVNARLIEDTVEKDVLLKKLIGEHEPAYAAQWRSLGEEYQLKMLAGIVGFELAVSKIQCKLKLNQHRPEATESTKALYARGGENELSLVRWMDRLGMSWKPPSQT
jgi:transcriptional regulator